MVCYAWLHSPSRDSGKNGLKDVPDVMPDSPIHQGTLVCEVKGTFWLHLIIDDKVKLCIMGVVNGAKAWFNFIKIYRHMYKMPENMVLH